MINPNNPIERGAQIEQIVSASRQLPEMLEREKARWLTENRRQQTQFMQSIQREKDSSMALGIAIGAGLMFLAATLFFLAWGVAI